MTSEYVEATPIDEEKGLAVRFQAGTIDADFTALKKAVDEIVAQYDWWEPNSDSKEDLESIAISKKHLKGIYDSIEERRKAVKRAYMEPLDRFDRECMDISKTVKDTRDRLMAIEKQADETRRLMVEADLQEFYEGYAGGLAERIPYSRIHDRRWTNKTVSIKEAEREIEERVARIRAELKIIEGLEPQVVSDARFFYCEDLNLERAITRARNKRDLEEYRYTEGQKKEFDKRVPKARYIRLDDATYQQALDVVNHCREMGLKANVFPWDLGRMV